MTPREVLAVFAAIEFGVVTVTPDETPEKVYAGNIHYCASNGWEFEVFNDCDSWDYVDRVKSPSGEVVEPGYPDTPEWDDVFHYRPSDEAKVTRWGWPERHWRRP